MANRSQENTHKTEAESQSTSDNLSPNDYVLLIKRMLKGKLRGLILINLLRLYAQTKAEREKQEIMKI